MFAGGAAKSHALAPRLAEVAARAGVPFVDAGKVVKVSPIDGIHYDAEANPVLARTFADAMQQYYP